jgi:hypothetical protein
MGVYQFGTVETMALYQFGTVEIVWGVSVWHSGDWMEHCLHQINVYTKRPFSYICVRLFVRRRS